MIRGLAALARAMERDETTDPAMGADAARKAARFIVRRNVPHGDLHEGSRFLPDGTKVKDLDDGTLGYFVRRRDDCFAAAMSTVLEVPIAQVPDWRLDERKRAGENPELIGRSAWAETIRWLADRGLRLIEHRTVPVRARRWIGIVPMMGIFNDHCLVMCHGQVIFDPSWDMEGFGRRVRGFDGDEVRSGYSFRKESRQ
jgi:hypothetical protein